MPHKCKTARIPLSRIIESTKEVLRSFLKKSQNVCKCTSKRLIGGSETDKFKKMFRQAIASAQKHGIDLCPGERNNADGNCAYEAVINNINARDCYVRKFPMHPNQFRHEWITHFEKEAVNDPRICAGYTDQEKKENWEMLRIPQVYEIPVFGDYVLYAIAKGCKKNILVFNTSVHASDPIYVIRGTEYGGSIDSDIPVIIAYNQAHYESLHPKSLEDIEKNKTLGKCLF